MRPLEVDFAPARRPVVALVAWAVVCAAATVALSLGAWRAWDARGLSVAKVAADASETARLQEVLRARAGRAAASAAVPAYQRDALTVARMAAFPTQQVLRSLETVAIDGVRVMAIELNAGQSTADVTLEFDDYKSLLAYLEALNEGEPVSRWMLVRAESSGVRRQAVIRSTWG
jgi:hypothetical protein